MKRAVPLALPVLICCALELPAIHEECTGTPLRLEQPPVRISYPRYVSCALSGLHCPTQPLECYDQGHCEFHSRHSCCDECTARHLYSNQVECMIRHMDVPCIWTCSNSGNDTLPCQDSMPPFASPLHSINHEGPATNVLSAEEAPEQPRTLLSSSFPTDRNRGSENGFRGPGSRFKSQFHDDPKKSNVRISLNPPAPGNHIPARRPSLPTPRPKSVIPAAAVPELDVPEPPFHEAATTTARVAAQGSTSTSTTAAGNGHNAFQWTGVAGFAAAGGAGVVVLLMGFQGIRRRMSAPEEEDEMSTIDSLENMPLEQSVLYPSMSVPEDGDPLIRQFTISEEVVHLDTINSWASYMPSPRDGSDTPRSYGSSSSIEEDMEEGRRRFAPPLDLSVLQDTARRPVSAKSSRRSSKYNSTPTSLTSSQSSANTRRIPTHALASPNTRTPKSARNLVPGQSPRGRSSRSSNSPHSASAAAVLKTDHGGLDSKDFA